MGELLPLIDVWNVMTYDRVGSWSKKSGNHAPGSWTLACAEAWIRRVGAERVSIGFPAYGYLFPGTTAAGQQLTGEARPVMVSQLDLARVVDSPERLASGLITDDGWVTFQSPAMILEVRRRLAAMGVDKTFTWSAEGLDEEYLEALTI